jgi:tetratricopeptide (TPR) repeat protein
MPDGMPLIDPDLVAARIQALLRERRPGAAKSLLAALAKLAPEHPEFALLRSAYFCQLPDFPEALSVLSSAIDSNPKQASLWLRRSDILYAQQDYANAAQDAAEAILLAPTLLGAKSRLGLALLKLGKYHDALSCLEESFTAEPACVEVALAIASFYPEKAATTLSRAIAAAPTAVALRNALTRHYFAADNLQRAMHEARQTCSDGIADAEAFCLLTFGYMQERSWDDAHISAAQSQSLMPGNLWAARLISALDNRRSDHLPALIMQNAELAELTLLAGGTIIPGSFRTLLEQSNITGPVIDIYCGTGLNAVVADGINIGPWSGIDPSAALLSRCSEHGLYMTLETADPLRVLSASTEKYAVILLNEALAYHASPEPWFVAMRTHLTAHGVALAAIPISNGCSCLTGHALFAHSLENIAHHAERSGLSFELSRIGHLRNVEGIPLHGVIASFRML